MWLNVQYHTWMVWDMVTLCFPLLFAYFFNRCTFPIVLPYPVSRIDLSLPLPPSCCWLHTDLDPLQDTKETRLASLVRKGAIIPSSLATLRKNITRQGMCFLFFRYKVLGT